MEWILYLIGGFILLCILWAIGIIPEFFMMIGMCLLFGCIGGFFSWLSDHGWGAGFNVGMIGGLVIYGICCSTRIVNPEIRVDFFDDGTTEWHSERANGIVGLLVLIGTIIFVILKW